MEVVALPKLASVVPASASTLNARHARLYRIPRQRRIEYEGAIYHAVRREFERRENA